MDAKISNGTQVQITQAMTINPEIPEPFPIILKT